MSTTVTPRKLAGIRRSRVYLSLIEHAELGDADALDVLGITVEADPRVAKMVAAGVPQDKAEEAVRRADQIKTEPETEPGQKVAPPLKQPPLKQPELKQPELKQSKPTDDAKDEADALVASEGLAFTRGRTYHTAESLVVMARVLKTGTPEIVRTSGVGRAKALLVYRTASGDLAAQHLADAE